MAQTAATADRAAPFPSPPGLEAPSDPAAIRESVLREVDAKVSQRVEALWQKGKVMLTQMSQKQAEKADKLAQEVGKLLHKQKQLEQENESLKQVLATVAQRMTALAQLGQAVSSDPASSCLNSPASTSALGTAMSSSPHTLGSATTYASEAWDPQSASSTMAGSNLPDVPGFPIPDQQVPDTTFVPTPTAAKAAPLRLSEALPPLPSTVGAPSPTLTAYQYAMTAEAATGYNPLTHTGVFAFTLRRADGTELGLNVTPNEHNVLVVEGIRQDGAVDAWNRQCVGSAHPEKAVVPRDRIISVNGIYYDTEKMLEECKEKQLLKLTVVRGNVPLPEPPTSPAKTSADKTSPTTSSSKSTSLNAAAAEFVPAGAK
eukprot:TRINITY_DN80344_c0_g1_i1.p1 TRINITY_DN80344_c0_g1~~TRINITY_DN80344_c0_g1_i1.p1  ORF type:complete len:373 (+),score=88.34 TRINITY_DN80344_c0_g1_i1:133-1251(+)